MCPRLKSPKNGALMLLSFQEFRMEAFGLTLKQNDQDPNTKIT